MKIRQGVYLFFTFLISIFDEKVFVVRLVKVYGFSSWQLLDLYVIMQELNKFSASPKTQERRKQNARIFFHHDS